jgi:predicted DNA-binding transcriptional regulator AlpA
MNKTNYSHPNLADSGFLRLPQILKLIPIGRSTWWAWVASGKAPAAVKLGSKTTAWRANDIRDFINSYNSDVSR